MAGGYEIPISLSFAASLSTPQNTSAYTVFNFGDDSEFTDRSSQEANPVQPTTATSATAQGGGDALASASGTGAYMLDGSGLGDNTKLAIIIAVGVLAGLYLLKRK